MYGQNFSQRTRLDKSQVSQRLVDMSYGRKTSQEDGKKIVLEGPPINCLVIPLKRGVEPGDTEEPGEWREDGNRFFGGVRPLEALTMRNASEVPAFTSNFHTPHALPKKPLLPS